MRIAFHTLGCKVNQYETEVLKEKFKNKGHHIVTEEDFADAYVINTCTVTNLADRKSRQYIRKMKKINPKSIVAVTGCYAQTNHEEITGIEGVNIIAGTNEKQNLVEIVEEYTGELVETHVRDCQLLDSYEEMGSLSNMESRTRAYVKIQEGCDRFCSYCIIPYARGQIRSRNKENVLEEIRHLVDKNYKEIVLTGINTALYDDLNGLLEEIDNLQGDFRVRLSSLEPTVINVDYVKGLFNYKRLCHHLHLSLQSGSNKVLSNMNRRYTREEYIEIVETLREFDHLYSISTDIIVGFPGESEEDFEDTLKTIEEIEPCKVHVFKYSKRKGTKAYDMENQIKGEVKKRKK